jgi:hypothetical protein
MIVWFVVLVRAEEQKIKHLDCPAKCKEKAGDVSAPALIEMQA